MGIAIAPHGDPRVLVRADEGTLLVAIFDGSGSWGTGIEAAAWTRARLGDLWRAPTTLSSDRIRDDLLAIEGTLPKELVGDEFGWSFSLLVALASRDRVTIVRVGNQSVIRLRSGRAERLAGPDMLVDRLVATGTCTVEEASAAVGHLCLGPYFGDSPAAVSGHAAEASARGDKLTPLTFERAPHDRFAFMTERVFRHAGPDLARWLASGPVALHAHATDAKLGWSPIVMFG